MLHYARIHPFALTIVPVHLYFPFFHLSIHPSNAPTVYLFTQMGAAVHTQEQCKHTKLCGLVGQYFVFGATVTRLPYANDQNVQGADIWQRRSA